MLKNIILLDRSAISQTSDYLSQRLTKTTFQNGSWIVLSSLESRIKSKIENIGKPLKDWDIQINYGIKTGFNEAFIISGEKRNELIEKCPEADKIIRPILRGRDIKSYKYNWNGDYIIFTRRGTDIDSYPEVKKHLDKFYDSLKPKKEGDFQGRKPGAYKWFEIQDNVAYYKDFDKEKVIWLELTDRPNFAFDNSKFYLNNTIFFMTGIHLKYLLGFLNSRICEWYFDKIAATSGVGTRRWIKIYIDQICVPIPEANFECKIEAYVDQTIYDPSLINKRPIETSFYELFNFSDAEIEIIENAKL